MFRLIVLKIILSALIISPIPILSNWIIKNVQERNQLAFSSTKAIIENNLSFIQYEKIDKLSYFDAYSYEFKKIISEAESGNLFYIVITNLDNEIEITNANNENVANDSQSRQIINLYKKNNHKNGYDKITRTNIKSAINKYGVNNNIGYAYFRYHPQKVKEIKQDKALILVVTAILYISALALIYFLLSQLFKKHTLKQIISRGENQGVEFKPCFFTDKNIEKKRVLEYECAKVISSFLNTNGGYLLIGVRDDGEIQGLDRDVEYIKNKILGNKKSSGDPNKCYQDKYIRRIQSDLGKRLNKNAVSMLKLDIKEIDDKKILAIKCPPARVPVLNQTKEKDSSSQKKTNQTETNQAKTREICFRKDSQTVIYQEIKSNLNNNQILPLWKLIVTNFSAHKNMSRLLLWKIKSLFVQI